MSFRTACGGEIGSFLDIGCGEGHALKWFQDEGWDVTGIDFSRHGLLTHHPELVESLIQGDIFTIINNIGRQFDFINADNVLEHMENPIAFFEELKNVCKKETIICIRVPNDFSVTQRKLYDLKCIDKAFWVTDKTSEHFNYFTGDSLECLAKQMGFECLLKVADWPIDFNLFNHRTNYYNDPSVGHDGHIARLEIENMMFEQSVEKTVALHVALAELGVGRDVSVYLKRVID